MSAITAADIVAQLRKRFGTRGSTNIDLFETIQPAANIADLDGPPFHGKGGFIAGQNQAAVAAQYTYITAFLDKTVAPPAARTVIRRVIVWSAATVAFQVGIMNDPNLAGSGVKAALTSFQTVVRSWDSVPAEVATDQLLAMTRLAYGTHTVQVNLSNPFIFQSLANTNVVVEGPWCLAPGNHLVVMSNAVNIQLAANFYGDEYLLG